MRRRRLLGLGTVACCVGCAGTTIGEPPGTDGNDDDPVAIGPWRPEGAGGTGGHLPAGGFGGVVLGAGGGGDPCPPGLGDCDGAPGCETDLSSTPQHCGACGQSCNIHAHGACIAGACALVSCVEGFADCDQDPENGCEISYCPDCADPCNCPRESFYVSGMCDDDALAIDSSSVYWSHGTDIYRASKNCGVPELMSAQGRYIENLIVDGQHIYFLRHEYPTTDVALVRLGLAGGVVTMATGLADCSTLASDETSVYVGCEDSIEVVPKNGAPMVTLTAGLQEVPLLALDATHAYFAAAGLVGRVPIAGGSSEIIVEAQAVQGLSLDASHIYWIASESVWKAPVDGGESTLLALDQPAPHSLATDTTYTYWATLGNGAHVARVPVDGGPVQVVGPQSWPYQLLLDQSYLYVRNGDWQDGCNGEIVGEVTPE